MFDGLSRIGPSGVPRPIPPRPAPMDVRAMLPVLRAEAAEIAVKFLAVAAAQNAIAVTQWLVMNWGAGADVRDPCHPARAAAMDETSPAYRLVEAQDALATACRRYRMITGRDGVALARERIEGGYGAVVTDYALQPVVDSAWLDDLTVEAGHNLDPLPPAPEPTPAQRRTSAAACAEWMLSEPEMGDLADRLRALLAACRGGDGDPREPGTAAAIQGVITAICDAVRRGCPQELLQIALDTWGDAAGGLRVTVEVGQPSTHPSKE
jgi:hypothetical protein